MQVAAFNGFSIATSTEGMQQRKLTSLVGHKEASRLLARHGASDPVTGRNRCSAANGRSVPTGEVEARYISQLEPAATTPVRGCPRRT
jgi:hypothetical protein